MLKALDLALRGCEPFSSIRCERHVLELAQDYEDSKGTAYYIVILAGTARGKGLMERSD